MTEEMDCYCDGEQPKFYNVTLPRARKSYRCDECGGAVNLGERYERTFAVYDCASTHRICERCRDLRVWVQNNVPCLCWYHDMMDEGLTDAINEACVRAPDETCGLKFGFLRRKVLRDRYNKASGMLTGGQS